MKQIILFFAFFLIISKYGFAQGPIQGEYRIDNYIDKFIGTWQWTTGQDTITIKLKKIKFNVIDTDLSFFKDVLMGCHKYVKNGIVIEDNLWKFSSVGQNSKGSIFGWSNNIGSDTSTVYSTFRDSTKHKLELIDMVYIPGTAPQISWLLYNRTEIDVPQIIPGITLPSQLVLTKQ